jgi:hypothetical protein
MSTAPAFPKIADGLPPPPEERPWGEPLPLPPIAGPVPTLPAALLPTPLQPWLTDVAERVCIPLEYAAVPALVSLGSVVGRSVSIRPMARDDWQVPANLWGGIVGPPGSMKTGAVDQALKPLRRLAATARKAFEDSGADRSADEASLAAQMKAKRSQMEAAAKKKDSTKEIAGYRDEFKRLQTEMEAAATNERRYYTSDSTIEKLGMLLNENPRGLLVVRDELTGWLRGLDREDRAQDRAFYLESWNGTGSFTVDRVLRGTLHVDALCLSLLGGIQPGRLSSYVNEAVAGEDDADGLLQRFQLLVWPDGTLDWKGVDRWPEKAARDRAFRIFEKLAISEPGSFGAKSEKDGVPYLRFAPDAQVLFIEWRHDLERRIRSDEIRSAPAFESHLAKFRSLFAKLALVFHLVDVADGGQVGPVSLPAAQLAAAWTEFLEAHARKVYSAELGGDITSAHTLAEKIRARAVVDGMGVRDIARREWSGLRTSGKVYAAIAELENLGWVRLEETLPGKDGGRPSSYIRVNPHWRPA